MDSTTAQRLALAWIRRRRWEQRMLAAEVVGLLGQAMGGKKDNTPAKAPARKGQWVSGGEMLAMMGMKL